MLGWKSQIHWTISSSKKQGKSQSLNFIECFKNTEFIELLNTYPIGSKIFEYDFDNKSVRNFQYNPTCTIANDHIGIRG